MRPIDADNFLDLFYVASAGQDKAFVAAVEMVVEDTPTIDAEPVRYEIWEEPYPNDIWDSYQCSGCGYTTDRLTNYCPSCGAKMDAGVRGDA